MKPSLLHKQKAFLNMRKLFAATAFLSAAFTAHADTIVTEWDDVALQAVRDIRPAPTVVARSLAVVHTAIYDAWAAYDERAIGTRFGSALRRPAAERTDGNKHEAISYAAYRALIDQFPTDQNLFTQKLLALGYDPANISKNLANPAGVGNLAAQAVIEFRHGDGSNQLGNLGSVGTPYSDYTNYQPINSADTMSDPNHWQPLRISGGQGGYVVQKFATPQWGLVTPFALKNGAQLRPPGPATVDQPEYFRQALQIVRYTANLTDRQKSIAEYWADGPHTEFPPGHWCLFSSYVSRRDQHTIDEDAKMFFAVTNALLDASIAAWDAKRAYDSVRPISAIQYLFKDRMLPYYDGNIILGKDWAPYQQNTVVTPPFAEFVSGHSTFSRAAAEVLRRFTHSNYFGNSVVIAAGSSKIQPGIPRHSVLLQWNTFKDAADEAGLSRRYGGIHFIDGDMHGRKMGARIGALVWQRATQYFRDGRESLNHEIDQDTDDDRDSSDTVL